MLVGLTDLAVIESKEQLPGVLFLLLTNGQPIFLLYFALYWPIEFLLSFAYIFQYFIRKD